jgi:hypothetical protein
MAWVQLTVAKFKLRFDESEVDAVLSQQTNADVTLTEYLHQVSADIVARVNTCRRTRGLSPVTPPALYVPPGSERHAYVLVQFMAGINLPSLTALQGDNRKSAEDRAENYLSDLASCEVDSDDEWVSPYVSACAPDSPVYGGMPLMNFVN